MSLTIIVLPPRAMNLSTVHTMPHTLGNIAWPIPTILLMLFIFYCGYSVHASFLSMEARALIAAYHVHNLEWNLSKNQVDIVKFLLLILTFMVSVGV